MATGVDTGPISWPWKAYGGDRNAQMFTFYASEGIPWDLTGCELKAQARQSVTDTVVALTATVTLVDAVNGLVRVEWDGEDIRTLLGSDESWAGVWDLEILEPGQTLPVTILDGAWTARADVTHD